MALVLPLLICVFLGGGIHSLLRGTSPPGSSLRRMLPWTPLVGVAVWGATALVDAHPRLGGIDGEAEHVAAILLLTLAVIAGAWVDRFLNDRGARTGRAPPERSGGGGT